MLRHAIWIVAIIALSFIVRAGTACFVGGHLDDAGWFQSGSYRIFDQRAQNIIDGAEPAFLITDPERTDLIQYPPAFAAAVGVIYMLTGERSPDAVHSVQWKLDALLMPFLIIGITLAAFGWRPAYFAGSFAALSPLLAFYGVTPSADAATTWVVLAAVWILLLAVKRTSWKLALVAGMVLGAACWFRVNPLFLIVPWAATVMLFTSLSLKQRAQLCCSLAAGTILLVAPIILRNVIVYRQFVLTGLSVGVNLWEGLGETETGRLNGFKYGDDLMLQDERIEMGRPDDVTIRLFWPDGISRDRERARRALALIAEHPLWYAGVMLERMYWMLKIAGEPGPYYGTAGINCTPQKCLPETQNGGLISAAVTVLGSVQSVYRYLAVILAALGIAAGVIQFRHSACILLSVVLYYLVSSSAGHTELRYVLPMHAVLVVFSGFALDRLIAVFRPQIDDD